MLKRFIAYYKPHKWLFWLDMGVSAVGALLSILIPCLTRKLLKVYVPEGQQNLIYITLGVMLGIIIVKTYLSYIRIKWGHVLGVRMESDMRADLFAHIQKLSFNYFDTVKTGHLMSRISNDLNRIAEVAHHAPEDLMISIFMIGGSFVFMFMFSVPLATLALIPLPIMLLWGIYYGGFMRNGFRRVRKKIADLNSGVENSVQGIREVKSYANEEEEISKFADVNYDFKSAKENMYGIMAIYFAGMLFLIEAYFLIVIAGGVWLINGGAFLERFNIQPIEAADLVAFILYIYFILKPIQRMVNFTEHFQQGAASFERFIEVVDIEPDIVDAKDALTFEPIEGQITFSNVSFGYTGSEKPVLDDISIEIPAHRKIAIVGESGSGKSTLVSLIPRFYEPQQGHILIDGRDISGLKQRFIRQNVGIVQQNVFLFDLTIRENIMYGNLQASDEQLIEAAKKANIYDFILSLPDGFDSVVGERGVMLSGGQKQRISIARVFLKDPPLFIFDEATSSLDAESEALIQNSLELLSRNRTTIIIAHRLTTVRNADYIYVLKHGKLQEHGTHDGLMAAKQYYHHLYSINML